MGVYFKGQDRDTVYNECKANWSYKTFMQDCYFKVKESDRVSRKYDGYYQLMKKYLNETQTLKDMGRKLKIRREDDFANQIVLPEVKAADLKGLLKQKGKNIMDMFKNSLMAKDIRIDKPVLKKFDKIGFGTGSSNQTFTVKIEGQKVINVWKPKEENEYLKVE